MKNSTLLASGAALLLVATGFGRAQGRMDHFPTTTISTGLRMPLPLSPLSPQGGAVEQAYDKPMIHPNPAETGPAGAGENTDAHAIKIPAGENFFFIPMKI